MPSVDDVREAKAAMAKRRADYEYFFSQLTSPKWIGPLLEEGFLKAPPKAELVDDGRFVRFPLWPESQYLVRMAEKAPETVVTTAAKWETDNPRVQEDIVDIALRVAPALALPLVPKLVSWLGSGSARWITRKFGELALHFAAGDNIEAAFSLIRELLWFDPDPTVAEKQAERDASESLIPPSLNPQSRTEEWEYEQTLKRCVPALAARDAAATIDLLCSVLSRYIALSHWDAKKHQPSDGSVYWRPAVEWQRSYGRYDDLLVNMIRDTAETYLRQDPACFDKVQATLARHHWDIFTRIYLYLLRRHAGSAGSRVEQALTNRRLFADHEFTHEYFHLAQEQYAHISAGAKKQILEWIHAGPDPEIRRLYSTDWEGNPLPPDIVDKRVKAWKVRKLQPIKEALETNARETYNSLVAEVGQPQLADLEVIHGEPEWGPTSPKSEDELVVLDTDTIVEFLRSWEPPAGTQSTPEGLARVFRAVVKRRSLDLSATAITFEQLDPTYVRALISGLADAVGEGKDITWSPVLKLSQWIVDQAIEITGRSKPDGDLLHSDPDWNWTRQTIARLVRQGCESTKSTQIPLELREAVWSLISLLTSDVNPTPDDEEHRAGSLKPFTLSINTTRGEAMHAVFAYVGWLNRNIGGEEKITLTAMPEVTEVLHKRLDIQVEPTLTIRSIYGQNLARLVALDRGWVEANLDRILPSEPERSSYWEIAWSSYIIANRCYTWAYDVLLRHYDRAIESLRSGGLPVEEANPNESLVDHLMILYWVGRLELENEPLVNFYAAAPPVLRAHALDFVGRALKNSGEVPAHQLERLQRLWESRLSAVTTHNEDSLELSKFATWFWSGKFDDDWALKQLIASMKASQNVEREFFFLERLQVLSETRPLMTLLALDTLVKSIHRNRSHFHGREEAKLIIKNAVTSGDPTAQEKARELANYLLSLRYDEFRDVALDRES